MNLCEVIKCLRQNAWGFVSVGGTFTGKSPRDGQRLQGFYSH